MLCGKKLCRQILLGGGKKTFLGSKDLNCNQENIFFSITILSLDFT